MADAALSILQATALTARCHNAFFRKKQLKALHDTLRRHSAEIADAIAADTHVSEHEATAEVALALDLVKGHHGAINTSKELEEEYRIAKGKDASDRREPWSVAYIEPHRSHTPFFSVIAALSAALAAGTCVAVKLEKNLRALPSLLRTLLTQALEGDTFAAVEVDPSPEALSTCLQVLQETHVKRPTQSQLASPNTKVIAIVDRTANLATAAEHLVAARFAFGGTSPYAPDVVLVNEFVKREFIELTLKYAIPFLTSSGGVDSNEKSRLQTRSSQKSSRVAEALKKAEDGKAWKLDIVTQGSSGAIVELGSLSALPPKASQPLFAVAAITSLEHAISLIDEDSQDESGLLAAYHFGTPSAGKYLSQFIKADVSLINHVDYRLLVGPAAPSSHTIDLDSRYSTEQFTRAMPAYVTTVQTSVSKMFASKESRKVAAALLANAAQEIKEKKRAEWIAIGFFEQGILIGLGFYGIPILTCVGASLFFGVRAGLQRWVF